MNQFISLV